MVQRSQGAVALVSLFLLIMVALFFFSGSTPTFAATANQTNVTVQVGTVTQLTVMPTQITWSSVSPGSQGGLVNLNIKNSGSVNITGIYSYADTLTSELNSPIGTGSPSAYSSGGIVAVKKNSTSSTFFVDRLEWNLTSKPAGMGVTNCANAASWGYFRNATTGSSDFLWCINNGSIANATMGCNATGTTFYVTSAGDNGTAQSRDPDLTGGSVSGQIGWGIFSGFVSGPLNGDCVAVSANCSKILIYKYDRRANPNFAACTQSMNLRDVTLTPGDQFTVQLDAWVPQGIPAGWLGSSWLTIED
jgi:hypothetical protein